MAGRVYGYIRVSSKDQNLARQLEALKGENLFENNIFIDKQSGKDFIRPEFIKLMGVLKKKILFA